MVLAWCETIKVLKIINFMFTTEPETDRLSPPAVTRCYTKQFKMLPIKYIQVSLSCQAEIQRIERNFDKNVNVCDCT